MMSLAIINAVKRALGKSPRVIFVRGSQELRLFFMKKTNGWAQLDKKIKSFWSDGVVNDFVTSKPNPVILSDTALEAFDCLIASKLVSKKEIDNFGQNIKDRKFSILSADVPKSGDWPWTSDWRFDYQWVNQDFKLYTYHEKKEKAYDVKYPWELSRLNFLTALFQKSYLGKDKGWDRGQIKDIFGILADWEDKNPYAHSVNWYPMEVAMRGIALVQILDFALLSECPAQQIGQVLKMITRHAEFLWRTMEDTDNRGNHYTADLIGLLVMSEALMRSDAGSTFFYNPALKWKKYVIENFNKEVLSQFKPDGVNFEMATGYHRLVTELFLIGRRVLPEIKDKNVEDRLRQACFYTASYRCPDGLAPIIGDCDDAYLFGFDILPIRNHAAIVALGAVSFDCDVLKSFVAKDDAVSLSIPWMLGLEATQKYIDIKTDTILKNQLLPMGHFFEEGGVVIAKDASNSLFVDVGFVGQNGLGGHGHNDVLSFELFLAGQPFIRDSGCYCYTGDKVARDRFRSSTAHNNLMIDDIEIAPFVGPFRIGNDAKPHSVSVAQSENKWHVQAGHTGYKRLADPVEHIRHIDFDVKTGHFKCIDKLSCQESHVVKRHLHFDSGVSVVQDKANPSAIRCKLGDKQWLVKLDVDTDITIEPCQVSNQYGSYLESLRLVCVNKIQKDAELFFDISLL